MSYAVTKSVREKILAALQYQLLTIREEDEWKNTVLHVVLGLDRRKDISKWPAIIIRPMRETVLNRDMADDLLHKELDVLLMCMPDPEVVEHEGVARFQNDILADIERLIGTRNTIPDESGEGTAFIARVMGSQTYDTLKDQTFGGIGIMVTIKYRQEIMDPTIDG